MAIEELETRVERLRSLYEQYFMGIEKIAPAVAHKDVTRRIDVLRHEQIRNTAKRFRLQMIIQRYNTFQQYWQRILREIENGTYRRHLLRMERSQSAKAASSIPAPPATEAVPVAEAASDSESLITPRARKSLAPSSPRHSAAVNPRQSTLPPPDKVEAFTRALERDLAAALDGDLDFGVAKRADFDDLALDLDEPASQPLAPAPAVSVAHAKLAPMQPPQVANATRVAALAGRLRLPAQSAVGGHRLPPQLGRSAASVATHTAVADANSTKGATGEQPATMQAKALSTQSTAQSPAPKPTSGQTANAPNTNAGPSAERVRELHRELMQAKAKINDSSEVSVASLSRKLEATVQQLLQKHVGKQVDFAVIIKEGKAVVKPIVR